MEKENCFDCGIDLGRTKYYHGGVKGLKIGDLVLPMSQTGKSNIRKNVSVEDIRAGHCLANRVYITTDLNAAKAYASIMPFGDVYVVEPIGSVETDIDAPGISFICPQAKVISIVQRRVKFKMNRVVEMGSF